MTQYKRRRARIDDRSPKSLGGSGSGDDESPEAARVVGRAPELFGPELVVFVCSDRHGAAHLATAWFAALADVKKARATLATTGGAVSVVPAVVVEALRPTGPDGPNLESLHPLGLTPELLAAADLVVTMGDSFDRRALPTGVGIRREHWLVPQFALGDTPLAARNLNDFIRSRVSMLAFMEGWGRADISRESTRIRRPTWSEPALA